MENDALGRVAHLHMALCDQLEDGAIDHLAIELAKSQSVAVDFPKTGIIPEVPAEALKLVKTNGYPDFMEKGDKNVYNRLLPEHEICWAFHSCHFCRNTVRLLRRYVHCNEILETVSCSHTHTHSRRR